MSDLITRIKMENLKSERVARAEERKINGKDTTSAATRAVSAVKEKNHYFGSKTP